MDKRFENLPEEQLEGLRACKTPEELIDYAAKNNIELPEDLLDCIKTAENKELGPDELGNVAGGKPLHFNFKSSNDGCPVYGEYHDFVFTGEERPTDAWFYDTEKHYKCACGKGYWKAGDFALFMTWEEKGGGEGSWE